ncbi:S8 family peptidase [Rheinheimera sp. UJ63]|uniref:S8 family peptidase n=1 Tax=Rheinheimera sp. UJ63 TaxID=2910157 RepID=UPI001F388916|nr:S8 family serine peptidase [Rheinheimera sp. UJ63]MCF4010647.1 S8 family serine peptidase [Rheinheimera sp. UJ63]
MMHHNHTVVSTELRSQVVHVPLELTIDEAEQLLIDSGLYHYVERDVIVQSSETAWHSVTPNDPEFYKQGYFNDNSAANPISSSVLSLWGKLQAPEKNVDVYVLDGGFRSHQDINYADGVNFVVVSFDNERKSGFLEQDFNESCESSHGLGVAGVIGAGISNANAITGMVGDVTIHPVRVLNCRNGFLSDVAASLDWFSGNGEYLKSQSPELPEFEGEPGIINMSLGGMVSECPRYLQNAINKAIAKGFVLVAAAGNESKDVAMVAPANCDGVISVGAAASSDYTPTDLSSFSNYGPTLDIMAQGSSVSSLIRNEQVSSWNGTSFSSPIVAGLLALVKKDFDFTPEQWSTLVAISGEHRWSENSRCESLGCGGGILDGVKLYENAEKLQKGELNSATYTLNLISACRQQWAVTNLRQGKKLCDQVSLALEAFSRINDREVIKLYAAEKGAVVNLNQGANSLTWIGDFSQSHFIMDKSTLLNRDVYGQICNIDTNECRLLMRVTTSDLNNVPIACQE